MTTVAGAQEPKRVTTLELFFDLVFVFTLTQLTTVLFEAPNGRGLLRVVVMLAVIWWMYAGYAWMTNAVDANTVARRVVLFAAMGAYFVLALSIPKAFDGAGLAFGVAYLLVVVMHTALFGRRAPVARRDSRGRGRLAVCGDGRPGRPADRGHRGRGDSRRRPSTDDTRRRDMATVTAHINVREAGRAAEWYERALDAAWQRALEAGASEFHPLEDAFWGERHGQITDPFGHRWGLAKKIADVAPDEVQRRATALLSGGQD